MSILIESTGGAFPLWLAPTQVVIASVSDKFVKAAAAYADQLRGAGIRVELDDSDDTVGKKVRNAEKLKVPYVLVFGEKEAASDELAARVRGQKDMLALRRGEFEKRIAQEILQRS